MSKESQLQLELSKLRGRVAGLEAVFHKLAAEPKSRLRMKIEDFINAEIKIAMRKVREMEGGA